MSEVFARSRDEGYNARVLVLAGRIVKTCKDTDRGLALEDWQSFSRRRASWVDVWRQLLKMGRARGIPVCTVVTPGTSITCPECGYSSRRNRPRRNDFCCVRCGFSRQSDRVAALNIAQRADDGRLTGDFAAVCKNPACRRHVWRAQLCCSCYFYKRRRGRMPDELELERIQVARNYREFVATISLDPPPRGS